MPHTAEHDYITFNEMNVFHVYRYFAEHAPMQLCATIVAESVDDATDQFIAANCDQSNLCVDVPDDYAQLIFENFDDEISWKTYIVSAFDYDETLMFLD